MEPRERLYVSILILLGFTLVGWLGYMFIEDVGPLEAAYMTVITISTVGFKEAFGLSLTGRIFTMFLITVGVASVSYAGISLMTLILGGELRAIREKLKVQKNVNKLQDHVILCGYGRMGQFIADHLLSDHVPLVVVDRSGERVADLEKKGALYVRGDAAEESTLQEAGISSARSLIATLASDADNVYVILTARGLRDDLFLVARAESVNTEAKLMRAGANRVVCPQVIGASRICNLITRPNVVDFVDVANRGVEFEIDEYVVGQESTLAGKTLRDAALRQRADAMVVAIKRAAGETIFNPVAEETVQAGDTLIIIGRLETSSRLAEL